jgi:hypothetical protein
MVLSCASNANNQPSTGENRVLSLNRDSISYNGNYSGEGIESVEFKNTISGMLFILANFENNLITNIIYPKRVDTITIGSNVFRNVFGNNRFANIIFPETVDKIRIGHSAFVNNQITNITFPKTIDSIEISSNAFANNQIASITFPEKGSQSYRSNKYDINIGDNAFTNNQITSIAFPKTVEKITIGRYAFANNQITSITFPEKVTFISPGQYKNNKLVTLNIPGNIKILFANAFENNVLETIELQEGIEIIEEKAFAGNRLTTVHIPQSVQLIEIGAFDPNVILTGKAVTLTPPQKYVWFSTIGFVSDLKITDTSGKQIQVGLRGIPPGVYTITGRIVRKIEIRASNGPKIVATYNINEPFSVRQEFKEGFDYTLVARANLNEDDLRDLEFQAARLGNSVYSERPVRRDVGISIMEEIISTK